jgi:endonuclease/exonuclease/phosphatase family metal-dependent hydrolase
MQDKIQIKFGLGISVRNLITEEELNPIAEELKEKGIDLEYRYFSRGAQASLDWLQPVIALYADSEMFRALVHSTQWEIVKHYLTTIIKTIAGRTYYHLTSRTSEERRGAITFVLTTPEKAAVHYSYEGVVSESDIKNSLNALVKAVKVIQPDTDKQNITLGKFNTEQEEWITKTVKDQLQKIQEAKVK